MYTTHTYQDWLATPEHERPELALAIIRRYKSSAEYAHALEASAYFANDNSAIKTKMLLKPVSVEVEEKRGNTNRVRKKSAVQEIAGNQIGSGFLFRFVTQRSQFLLSNGVTLDDDKGKVALGADFDGIVQQMAESALVQGVAYAYYNADHVELLPAVRGTGNGFVGLLDETTSALMVGIQYWQLSKQRPLYVRIFEPEGVSVYRWGNRRMEQIHPRRAYKQTIRKDALGEDVIDGENYAGALPIVPLYADDDGIGMLTPSLKSKIDVYARILSDFADNLDRANDVYWVLNNFGGTTDDIVELLEEINRVKAVANISDGTGNGSTAEPHTIEVPYEARRVALDLLERAMYQDAMALDMDALTGGSLTNVAINAASRNLHLACDRLEWQVRRTVQGLLQLAGVETESIRFKRNGIANDSEIIQDIYVFRDDITREYALRLNPMVDDADIEKLLAAKAAEDETGEDDLDALEEAMKREQEERDAGAV